VIGVYLVAIMTIFAGIFLFCGGVSLLRENIRDRDDFELFVGSIIVCLSGVIILGLGIGLFFCK